MPSRTLPNLGLIGFFDLGEDGWDDEMSANLLKMSVLTQATVLSKVAATPGSPTNGDVHIFDETHPTQPNKIAIRDNGAWVYVTPAEGWLVYNQGADYYEKFNGTAWAQLVTGGGSGGSLPVTSQAGSSYTADIDDADTYIRFTSASAVAFTIPPNADVAYDVGTVIAFEQADTGVVTLTPGSGVTINSRAGALDTAGQFAVAQVKKVATNTWTAIGDLE